MGRARRRILAILARLRRPALTLILVLLAGPVHAQRGSLLYPAPAPDDTSLILADQVTFPTSESTSLPAAQSAPLPACDGCDPYPRVRLFGKNLYQVWLPGGLLWQVPHANQREPRMYGKLSNATGDFTIDTAVGGQLGLGRLTPPGRPHDGVQVDFFAAVFSRFDGATLVAADYRVGVPLTYARGPWQAKLSYEHTSSHLGDEFLVHHPDVPIRSLVRDEMVLGLAYRFAGELRAYGQAGVAFGSRHPPGGRGRFDVGLEWARQRDCCPWGQPFAAIDLDFRPEHDYRANLTVQVGWQWMEAANRRSLRAGFEYYNGRSPYGEFFLDEEDWVAFSVGYDW